MFGDGLEEHAIATAAARPNSDPIVRYVCSGVSRHQNQRIHATHLFAS